ncbi:hypothetical protein L2E82_08456 [Cichorium intybus]|uniref:Uncharacterized protein n=1 Tax=Cichorium intybus TaxID=13427 RepID=A0ACB9G6I2_CICIN|nr:hypothetical protein L2E82_08456 [Cichorium intybus]
METNRKSLFRLLLLDNKRDACVSKRPDPDATWNRKFSPIFKWFSSILEQPDQQSNMGAITKRFLAIVIKYYFIETKLQALMVLAI